MQSDVFIFLAFILNGVLIGISFDCFRILRKSFKTPDFATYIEDILFGIITGLLLLYSIMKFNNGEIRLFLFLGVFIGLLLYLLLFSNIFIKVSVYLISIIKKIVEFVIIIPIKFVLKIFRKIVFKPIIFICINIKSNFRKLETFIKHLGTSFKIFQLKSTKKVKNQKDL